MKILEPNIESVFNIQSKKQFEELSLQIFQFQASKNKVYKDFLQLLKINPTQISCIEEIPFMPISFFKSHKVVSKPNHEKVFKSSGTGNMVRSQHYVNSLEVYRQSFNKGFSHFYQDHKNFTFLAFCPLI